MYLRKKYVKYSVPYHSSTNRCSCQCLWRKFCRGLAGGWDFAGVPISPFFKNPAEGRERKAPERCAAAEWNSAKRGLGAGAANEQKQLSGGHAGKLFWVFVGTNTLLAK